MEGRSRPPWQPYKPLTPTEGRKPTIPQKRPADDQEAAWVADEDRFVLKQAKKKAALRVRGGRAKPIDWLAVTLQAIDPNAKSFDEEDQADDLDIVDPEGVFENLDEEELRELEKDIETYMTLETKRSNKEFWETMKVICNDRLGKSSTTAPHARGVSSVASDIDKMLKPKSYEELEKLEKQIRKKLGSNEPIDTDYWEHLLRTLLVYKARARLRKVSQNIVKSRLDAFRVQKKDEAAAARKTLVSKLAEISMTLPAAAGTAVSRPSLDPDPFLKLSEDDKSLEKLDEADFLRQVAEERRKVVKLGYVPAAQKEEFQHSETFGSASGNGEHAQASTAFYEREVARGVNENEEIFTGEEQVATVSKPKWADKYQPRKPKYFNRVQMGYEWNKYNQTHYDHDNPPPKVVQGYKFNIFYPDLIDKSKTPTYSIEREGGRKRGESSARAGEDDTCLIRFTAGPPYEDIAFRIVDREWDYSAKRDRGFRSSFDRVCKHWLSASYSFVLNYHGISSKSGNEVS